MTSNTIATRKIEVHAQIGGYTIRIDKFDITLNEAEVILLTQQLLKKGCGLNLADVQPTAVAAEYVNLVLNQNA